MCGLPAETQKKVAGYHKHIFVGVFVVAIMWHDVGTFTRLSSINIWGLISPLSLSLNKRDASSFGDVKQICFAEAFCRERISPLMRCRGIFPFLFPQLSPNISFILPIPCWPCCAEPVQSLSLDTGRTQKSFYLLSYDNKNASHTPECKMFNKKKKKKRERKSRITW